jgi:hypothetical protein
MLNVGVCGQLPFIIADLALGVGQAKYEAHNSSMKKVSTKSEQVLLLSAGSGRIS